MRHQLIAVALALLLPVPAMADGAFWTGGALGGAGSGGVSSSATFELDVGTPIVLDADATGDDTIQVSSDGTMVFQLEGVTELSLDSTAATFSGGIVVGGTSTLAGSVLSSSGMFSTGAVRAAGSSSISWNTKTELFSDEDGQLQIEQADNGRGITLDANDAVDTLTIKDQAGTGAGNLALINGANLVFDGDTDSDTFFTAAGDTISITNNGDLTGAWTAAGLLLYDSESPRMGSGGDQTLTYTDGTGVQWNDGTNDVIVVPDDSNQVNLVGGLYESHDIIDCSDDGYAIPAGVINITVRSDTGTCSGNMDVTLPASSCTAQTAQDECRLISIKNVGSVQVDVGGFGGTETIDGATSQPIAQWGALTVKDTGATETDWGIH